jgi:DNA-binding transcriptional LysR family regulator
VVKLVTINVRKTNPTLLQGLGITRLLYYQIAPHLESGQLQTVLTDFEPETLPIHVIHREGCCASAKVRTFVDLMVARLRSDKTLGYTALHTKGTKL